MAGKLRRFAPFRPGLAAMAGSMGPIGQHPDPIRLAAEAIPKRYLLPGAHRDTQGPGSSNKGFRSWLASRSRSNLGS